MSHDVKQFLHDMIPAAISLVFMSLYMIVDGAFVSLFVGADALAAINIVYPIADLMYAFGSMFASGTAVMVSIRLGQQKKEQADQAFSMGFIVSVVTGVLLMVFFLICLKPICLLLGATERTMEYCIQYGVVTCIAIPCGMLKEMYLFLLRADNAPKLSMALSILGGVTNVVLDYVFVAVFDWGIAGAGWATVIGMLAGSLVGVVHFASKRAKLRFHFVVPKLSFVWRISMNGMSNFTNNFAAAIITFLYNMVTIPLAGEAGVAAVTMILYAQFLFLSIFTGYMAGAAPTLGYNYGAGNVSQNKKLVRFLIVLVMITSVVMFALAELFGGKLIGLLVTEEQVNLLADRGMQIYSWGFLAAGVNIFVSGLFTAYGNGLQGGMIAFSRALFVLGAALLTLPHFFGVDGIWLAGAVAEFVTLFLSLLLFFLPKNRKKHEYI